MFNADVLTFQEFIVEERLPLSTIQQVILEFLAGRQDVVLFGAQAVNAYVSEPCMTQDINLLSTQAYFIAQTLRDYLSHRFHIAVRVRQIGKGRGYRLYQAQKGGGRHLVDIRQVDNMPDTREIAGIQVMAPDALIASKIIAYHQRRGKPKAGTDWRDLAMLLLAFPELKSEKGPVYDALQAAGADPSILELWRQVAQQVIEQDSEEDEF